MSMGSKRPPLYLWSRTRLDISGPHTLPQRKASSPPPCEPTGSHPQNQAQSRPAVAPRSQPDVGERGMDAKGQRHRERGPEQGQSQDRLEHETPLRPVPEAPEDAEKHQCQRNERVIDDRMRLDQQPVRVRVVRRKILLEAGPGYPKEPLAKEYLKDRQRKDSEPE